MTGAVKAGARTLRTTRGEHGRDRYILRWINGTPCIYLRQYLGVLAHSRPKRRDVYLGTISPELALDGSQRQLSAAAYRLRQRRERKEPRNNG